VVELSEQLIPAADKDIIRMYMRQAKKKFNIMIKTEVTEAKSTSQGIQINFRGKNAPEKTVIYDAVLVAVGRLPSGRLINAENAGIHLTDNGFIKTDNQMRTNVANIFAAGDITGQPMLAHKGTAQGHIAAEVIAGQSSIFSPKVIPSIAYTSPEVAWTGLTEREAEQKNIKFETATYPWSALGRAVASASGTGVTKLIFEKSSNQIIGGAVVGENAGEILGEISLAIEMKATAKQIANTIHAHPSLHESIGLAAEIKEGTITDLPNKKKSRD
jgi:dihydrolipoamide dehydrogenase